MAVPSARCYECGCTEPQNPDKPFCMHCGHQRDHHTPICGHCHEPLGNSTAFCQHCGTPIERATGTPAAAAAPSTPAPAAARSSACTLCDCHQFRFVSAGGGCGTCGHYAAAHDLAAADVAALGRGEPISPPPLPRLVPVPERPPLPVVLRPLTIAPKGLIAAAWVAGIFGTLSVIVGIAGYSDSSSSSSAFGDQVQSTANTATLIAGIGIGAFWLMVCCFCTGLHGHLDRIARATLEHD